MTLLDGDPDDAPVRTTRRVRDLAHALPASAALAAHRLWRQVSAGLLDVVYPPSCVACRAATAVPHGLCADCWRSLALIERPYCERLGTPFAVDLGTPLLSPAAIADPPVFGRARSAVRYDGVARDLVHGLKFSDRPELARMLGRMMAQAGREVLAEADLVVPVPLHRLRLWSRRFNQAALLGAEVSRLGGVRFDATTLVRRKRTRPQVGLTRAQRAQNLEGAFHVPKEHRPRLAGRRIVLVDDVMTTAATANAAARVLLRAGAANVDVLTFACVVRDA